MIEAPDLTRLPGVLFGAGGVDVAGTTERVREVPRPITASDVVIGTRRRLPPNQVIPGLESSRCKSQTGSAFLTEVCPTEGGRHGMRGGISGRLTAPSPNAGRGNRINRRIVQ